MAREKTITLFNKNHITVKKYENRDFLHGNTSNTVNLGGAADACKSYGRTIRESKKPIEVKKISKLAPFYYTVTEYPKSNKSQDNAVRSSTKRIVYICAGDHAEYEIIYYTGYNNVSISHEMRPWDIVEGDSIFEEHFITDLFDLIKNIFTDVNIDSMQFNGSKGWWDNTTRYDNGSTIRITVLKELFGDKDGYKQQTNESKILSHGFDLKTSFRKPKQDK